MKKSGLNLKDRNILILLIIVISIFLGVVIGMQCKSINIHQSVDVSTSVTDKNKININKASLKQLKTLPSIGDKKAIKIINSRPYTNINELIDVVGIKCFNNIKDKVVR